MVKASKIEQEKIFEQIYNDECHRNWKRTLKKIKKEGEKIPQLVRDEQEKYEKIKRKRDKTVFKLDVMFACAKMNGIALERKQKFLTNMWAKQGKKGCNLEDVLPMSMRLKNAMDVMGAAGGK